MNRVFRHLRVLWRLESTIAEARLRITLRRAVLYAVAGLIAVFGLAMLNAAAFFALEARWGPVWAAVAAALGDFALALVVTGIALAANPGAEMTHAVELRQTALDGMEAEISALQEPFAWLSRAARNPIDTALPAILLPLVTAIVRGLRKHKTDSE
ncbi:MAG: phage holin family protein [Xanthobacteraceae bacterium]